MKVRGRQENKMAQNATRIGKPKTRAQHKKREIENMKMNTPAMKIPFILGMMYFTRTLC